MTILRLTIWSIIGVSLLEAVPAAAEDPADYESQVKPLLRARCYACHGALKQEGGLRLDTAVLILAGGDSGDVVATTDPDSSLLIKRVSADDAAVRMPPESEGEALSDEQIVLLRKWIEAGAPAPAEEQPQADPKTHWAFQPVVRPPVPVDEAGSSWVANPIDAFIAQPHRERDLVPQPPADKRVWLRRVSLDLVGLPPSPDEVAAFLSDDSAEAYDRVVARLLDSPQYGERWGRHWMDIWRYSDWWGLGAEVRNSQKHIWRWRDWIIESLNTDLGYDQMLREMLAADELYPNDFDRLRATGYLSRQYFIFNRTTWLDETIEHTAKGMLGLTFNCAKCHDHKYDPLTQQEYYELRAIFEPYQVRTEMVANEPDFEKAGLTRAFDANLDAETFLHVRGDDRNPDKSLALPPGVPAFLSSDDLPLSIEPVALPIEAVHPGMRPFVVEAHRAAAEHSIAEAREAVELARQQVAERVAATDPPGRTDAGPQEQAAVAVDGTNSGEAPVVDRFSEERTDLWESLTGQWKHENGRLLQRQTGFSRAAMRLKPQPPSDFEASLKYVVTGGEVWKSVGIACDVTAQGNEVLAYASAVDGGSKIQIAYREDGEYVYPAEAGQAQTVTVGQPHEIVLRVRGRLVNLQFDGEPSVAFRLPAGMLRQRGALELVAFDAAAEMLEFQIRPLPADVMLVEASETEASTTTGAVADIAQAKLTLQRAEKQLVAAEALKAAVAARAAADQGLLADAALVAPELESLRVAASHSERLLAVARADEELSGAELALLQAAEDKKPDAEKKIAEAKTALEQARKAIEAPDGSTYTPLPGALRTKENYQDPNLAKPFPLTSSGRRTAFANWLTDPDHPLPARVAMNHIWARHMGTPLVPSVFDFGLNGKPPTHPELLDWLAAEFVDRNWSMKHIHRLILTSQVYRLSSANGTADAWTLATDPDNRFYWRMNPARMEAQIVRDSLLHLAGELDLTIGGPPVPAVEESNRRSLYFVHSHNEHHKFLSMFDDASVLECYRRAESIVPQQALALENSGFATTIAVKVAGQIIAAEPSATDAEFVRAAFLFVLCHDPTEVEQQLVVDTLLRLTAAASMENRPDPEQHARVAVIQALFNHNDFVTIR